MQPISQFEQEARLDGVVSAGQRLARLIRPGKVQDALHGVWLGHPVHPLLVQVSAGAWVPARILDFAGAGKASRQLAGAGLAAAVLAALAGAADWSEQHVLRMAGLAAMSASGLLGGHISFRMAGGASHAEEVPYLVEPAGRT
jgi:hypothetical protein